VVGDFHLLFIIQRPAQLGYVFAGGVAHLDYVLILLHVHSVYVLVSAIHDNDLFLFVEIEGGEVGYKSDMVEDIRDYLYSDCK
jgi:hypothetical protein